MPLICKDMMDLLDSGNTSAMNHSSLSNYAYIYGVFPVAPSVALYAVHYGAELEVVSCLHLPANLPFRYCTVFFFFVTMYMIFLFCFLTGSLRDGDQHFCLSSNNVCFCLVAHNPADGSSAFDEFTAECQL